MNTRHLSNLALSFTLALTPAMQAGALDPQLEDRLAALQREVGSLRREMNEMHAMLSRDAGGNVVHTAPGNRFDRIGGRWSEQVARDLEVAVAREIVLNAGDQLTLKSGSALIRLQKDGSIQISGTDIGIVGTRVQVKGSGDVVIKGARTLTN